MSARTGEVGKFGEIINSVGAAVRSGSQLRQQIGTREVSLAIPCCNMNPARLDLALISVPKVAAGNAEKNGPGPGTLVVNGLCWVSCSLKNTHFSRSNLFKLFSAKTRIRRHFSREISTGSKEQKPFAIYGVR
jgi:hypothetical protein